MNFMFNWYRNLAVCYPYVEDVEPDESNFADARWFTRGWALQELIAPRKVLFYSKS
jgi:hypothetical protein